MGYALLILNIAAAILVGLLLSKIVAGPFSIIALNAFVVAVIALVVTLLFKNKVKNKGLFILSISIPSIIIAGIIFIVLAALIFMNFIWSH